MSFSSLLRMLGIAHLRGWTSGGWLWALVVVFAPARALGHPVDSATLVLREGTPGVFHVQFQSGSPSLAALEEPAQYPAHCRLRAPALDCGPRGLSGTVEFPWLSGTLTHLLVDIQWRDGARQQRIVRGQEPFMAVYARGARGWAALGPVLADYGWLGVEHILLGFDHLCLVVALTLLVPQRRRLLLTITAFTAAHSVTLALTILGLLHAPSAPVEATIALSIVLVCAECLKPRDSLTRRAPWIVALAFGLLHGFGFAAALLDVGLPRERVPSALLGFNLGVELGQIAIVLAVREIVALMTHFALLRSWMPKAVVYAMGAVAAYWSLERALGVFGI